MYHFEGIYLSRKLSNRFMMSLLTHMSTRHALQIHFFKQDGGIDAPESEAIGHGKINISMNDRRWKNDFPCHTKVAFSTIVGISVC
mmetsp:Transcript_26362/g.60733  ORF Transcript_26362/g.60733 Transcript_26362/m.60733 type:complete len:86 (-) Transcript_26362:337-594(-)